MKYVTSRNSCEIKSEGDYKSLFLKRQEANSCAFAASMGIISGAIAGALATGILKANINANLYREVESRALHSKRLSQPENQVSTSSVKLINTVTSKDSITLSGKTYALRETSVAPGSLRANPTLIAKKVDGQEVLFAPNNSGVHGADAFVEVNGANGRTVLMQVDPSSPDYLNLENEYFSEFFHTKRPELMKHPSKKWAESKIEIASDGVVYHQSDFGQAYNVHAVDFYARAGIGDTNIATPTQHREMLNPTLYIEAPHLPNRPVSTFWTFPNPITLNKRLGLGPGKSELWFVPKRAGAVDEKEYWRDFSQGKVGISM